MAQRLKIVNLFEGQRFGRLTVLHTLQNQRGDASCECRCDCGKVRPFRIHNLIGGLSASCGCASRGSKGPLDGKHFGRLVVLYRDDNVGRRFWVCRCSCGDVCTVSGTSLRRGQVIGCGCQPGEMPQPKYRARGSENLGKELTLRLRLFSGAQRRARDRNLPFNLALDDIQIPDKCPLLGIPLMKGHKGFSPHSFSLDRIDGALGYVKGNVQVISNRANLIKRDASLAELERIVQGLKHLKHLGDPNPECQLCRPDFFDIWEGQVVA